MKKYDQVQITKLHPLIGRDEGYVQTGHVSKGLLANEPEVGASLYILRYESNGVVKPGLFFTSRVEVILELPDGTVLFDTMNSRYKLERISEPIPAGVLEGISIA